LYSNEVSDNDPNAESDDNKLDSVTTNNKEQELLATINDLKAELEKEKATINALQKQKEGKKSLYLSCSLY
jgi:enterochelin esterase-like enzyme